MLTSTWGLLWPGTRPRLEDMVERSSRSLLNIVSFHRKNCGVVVLFEVPCDINSDLQLELASLASASSTKIVACLGGSISLSIDRSNQLNNKAFFPS